MRESRTFSHQEGRAKMSAPARRADAGLPVGSAASLLLHFGIVACAILLVSPPEPFKSDDVVAVDIISDAPSTIGPSTMTEAAQSGADTPLPSPLPQALTPSPEQDMSLPEAPAEQPPPPAPTPELAPEPLLAPAPVLRKALPEPPPPPPTKTPAPAKARPAPKPVPKPAPAPSTKPSPPPPSKLPAQAAKALPKPTKPTPNPRASGQSVAAAPAEFDLAAASAAATGADSGGRRAPALAASGQPVRLGKAGGGVTLTGDLEAALRAQIKECWAEPADMSNPSRLLVVVSIDLSIDGRLMRNPVLVTPSSRAGADPTLLVAIDNALRATRQCAPYNLPPDRYESWRQVKFSFDPKRMQRP